MSFINTTTTISAGTGIVYTNGSNISNIEIDKSLIEYIELLYQLIGVDMTFDKFKNLSTSEKQAFIRDIKIKKLLDNAIPEN